MRITPQSPAMPVTSSTSLNTNLKRRRFVLALSAGTAGSAAAGAKAVASPVVGTGATPPAPANGYRETKHVRDYYKTTRL